MGEEKNQATDTVTHTIRIKKIQFMWLVIVTLVVRHVGESINVQKYIYIFVANVYNHIILL
jgi:hypothetical protein